MKVGEDTIGSRSGITEFASKVAEKCHGLPLALNVLGEEGVLILPTPPIPYIRLVLNPSLMGKLLDSKAGKDSTLHFVCYLPSFSFRRYLLESFKKNHTLQSMVVQCFVDLLSCGPCGM
ncbi:unnamed protein product [Microthlaspi erraticum]|uniref:NB-ARC domain-containing protein n=1 Tax=Microthlaspi erraticum TaxID=1685480 RepID=A0A6D2J044_9BRAS|nr:unnamed protein product [Microthlaspi erraticum]